MAANLNQNKLLKIKKLKYFNGNGYLQGIRHAAPYGDHFSLLWWPFILTYVHNNNNKKKKKRCKNNVSKFRLGT
jgi:hypothetical protein